MTVEFKIRMNDVSLQYTWKLNSDAIVDNTMYLDLFLIKRFENNLCVVHRC